MTQKQLYYSHYALRDRVMVNYYAVVDGKTKFGQSQVVKKDEWPVFRDYLERGGWRCDDQQQGYQ